MLYYVMFAVVAVSIGLILSLTVFFKTETIEVEGSTKYQPGAIIGTAGIQVGDNLFRIDDQQVEKALTSTYPYIESVSVRRALPSKVTLRITEAVELGAFVQQNGTYVLVSETGRVLEIASGTPGNGVLVVNGVEIEDPQLCQAIPAENNESLSMLQCLVEAIRATGFENITRIDLSDRLNMYIVYDDRVRIELGSETELPDKLDFAKYALENNVRSDFEGIMDVTMTKRISILPAEIHDAGYHGEETPPEEEPTDGEDAAGTEGEASAETPAESADSADSAPPQ